MPSNSLQVWQNDRLVRLSQVVGQCNAIAASLPSQPSLLDENLRACVLLLSAHFQGFCRDLYTECGQVIASRIRSKRVQLVCQSQFDEHRKLDHGNPTVANIRADLERFGFELNLEKVDAGNPSRITDLGHLNRWRNAAAHHGNVPLGIPLTLPNIQKWHSSCSGLALSLDGIMYDGLRKILRKSPW